MRLDQGPAEMLEAFRHLEALGLDHFCIFQILPDVPNCHVNVRTLKGSFIQHSEKLLAFNEKGFGIFFQVNGGTTRKQRSISEVTTLFLDFDNVDHLPQLLFEPHLVVKSKRGFHVYWRIQSSEKISLWCRVMSALCARHGADSKALMLNQLLRVPGFFHCKGEPYKVSTVERNDSLPVYDLEKVAWLLGIEPRDEPDLELLADTICVEHLPILERRFLFKLVKYELGRQRRKIRNAKEGSRRRSVLEAASCLGHHVHWGLDRALIFNLLMTEVSSCSWKDHDLSPEALKETIESGIVHGINGGPPDLNPVDAKELAKLKRGHKTIERAKQDCLGWPDRLTIKQAKDLLGDLDGVWASSHQASHQVGKFLRKIGYQQDGWSNGYPIFVREIIVPDNIW